MYMNWYFEMLSSYAPHSSKSLHAFTLQLTNQTHRDSPLLENLCKWNYFKGLIIHELCEHYSAIVDLW